MRTSVMIMAVPLPSALICALAVLLFACGRNDREVRRDENRDENRPVQDAPSQPTSQAEDKRPVLVTFGDSISAGFGVEPGRSYPDDLQRLLDKAGRPYRVVNLGVSGDTTTDGVERLPLVLAAHASLVVLEFGGNDGLRGLPVSAAESNLAIMIEAIQKSGARVILAGMTLPRNYGPEYIRSFEQMYANLAHRFKVPLIPFLLEGVGGNAALTQRDGIHPTAKGAEIVASTVMKYVPAKP